MREAGLSLENHRSATLTADRIARADAIYTMTEAHRAAVLAQVPGALEKTHLLDPGGESIADPIGGDTETYRRCAQHLRRAVLSRVREITEGSPG